MKIRGFKVYFGFMKEKIRSFKVYFRLPKPRKDKFFLIN